VTAMQTLLATFHRKAQLRGSKRLATSIQQEALTAGRTVLPRLADRGVRHAMFYVLVGARMPAALVEASFLTYEPEAKALATRHYRRRLADGIAKGIAAFLQAR